MVDVVLPCLDEAEALGAEPCHVEAYRQFLSRFAERTGHPLVEILVPPLSRRAANAVRRPTYATLWTGDPDRSGYLDPGSGRYIPLDRITLRRTGTQVVAEVDGQQIWPVMHTTRLPLPPWDTVTALLLSAWPQPERERWRALRYSLPAWPRRRFVPRITVDGEFVLTPAQWRIRADELWNPGDRLTDKVIRLERLSRRLRIPRLVNVVADVHHDPVAVDLASLPGLRVLDRFVRQGAPTLVMRELLAEPERLPVVDDLGGGRACEAELLLRLPAGPPAGVLVDRTGAARARDPRLAGLTAERP